MLQSPQRSTVQGLQLSCTSSTPLLLKVSPFMSASLIISPVCKLADWQRVMKLPIRCVMGRIETMCSLKTSLGEKHTICGAWQLKACRQLNHRHIHMCTPLTHCRCCFAGSGGLVHDTAGTADDLAKLQQLCWCPVLMAPPSPDMPFSPPSSPLAPPKLARPVRLHPLLILAPQTCGVA